MTKQERILTAMKLGVPDRVPIIVFGMNPYQLADEIYPYYWGIGFFNVFKDDPIYHRLMKVVAEKTDIFYVTTFPNFYANCIKGYHENKPRKENNLIYLDRWIDTPKGQLYSQMRIDPNVASTWTIKPFIENQNDMEKIFSAEFKPYSSKVVDSLFLRRYFAAQKRIGDQGVMHIMLLTPLHEVIQFCNYEFIYQFLYEEKSLFHQFLQKISDVLYESIEKILSKDLAPAIIRLGGSEYAVSPFCPPEVFYEYVIEYDTPLVNLIHKYGCLVQWHCHGKIMRVLNMIIRAKPDALEPIEPPPDGDITLAEVKEIGKGKICLVGNIEARHLLGNSTPQEIDRLVKEAIGAGVPGGGFILAPTALLPISKLTEHQAKNLLQYIESGLKYGK